MLGRTFCFYFEAAQFNAIEDRTGRTYIQTARGVSWIIGKYLANVLAVVRGEREARQGIR